MENALAKRLVDSSLTLTRNDLLVIDYQDHTLPLYSEVEKEAQLRGARVEAFSRPTRITLSDLERLSELVESATAYLKLGGGQYKKLESEEEKMAIEIKEGEIRNRRCSLKWTLTPYPSPFMARRLKIDLDDLRDVYFRSCFVDYSKQRKIQEILAQQFSPGEVRIKSPDTNILFNILREPHFCCGNINMPDGELFYEVDPLKTEGNIGFSIPTLFGSAYFEFINLRFKEGKVVEYDSNQIKFLRTLLILDPFASFLGEFGIGTNPFARVVGHSFIDEKVAGTFHLALGAMSPEMESSLHLDLVKSLQDCKITNNGRIIRF